MDVAAAFATGRESEANTFVIADEVARAIRAHVRTLCRAVAAWDDIPPIDLVNGLVQTIRLGAGADSKRGRVSAFSAHYEAAPYSARDEHRTVVDLADALRALADQQREALLEAILEIDEPAMLADLRAIAPVDARGRILARINELTRKEAADVYSLSALQVRIEKLLATGALDAAARFVEVERTIETRGKVPGRLQARLTAELQLRLLGKDFDAIEQAKPPEGLDPNDLVEAENAIAFYKALAELRRTAGDLNAAEMTFERLHKQRSDIVAYGVNLIAVRVSRLLQGNLFGLLRGKDIGSARLVLAQADAASKNWSLVSPEDLAAHHGNEALLLLAIGHPEQARDLLASISSSQLQDQIEAYESVALARMGRREEAIDALQRAAVRFGDTESLRAAREHIARATPLDGRASSRTEEDSVNRIRLALADLRRLDPIRQADVVQFGPDPFDRMVIEHVRTAAASVVALVPMMKNVEVDSCEDDLTALVKAILAPALEFVGWSVTDQSRGGFTARGNAGERDLVLTKGSATTLAIVEAVVCHRPATHEWARKELTSHFQKLPAYSNCRLFFHLTYSYVEDTASVLAHLQKTAQDEAPTGLTFKSLKPHPRTDSRPPGFSATYGMQLGEVKIVFLLLDMGQHDQRNAAALAASTNPRTGSMKKARTSRDEEGA
jgi:tetratricopeptide (TPR) repeat protein